MPNVYTILGDADTRKSSTVRALTGVYRKKRTTVETAAGDIDVFVQVSSLQESEKQPEEFIADMVAGGYQNVLVTLWVSQRHTPKGVFPRGVEYLEAFIAAGWTLVQVVVLGESALPDAPAGTPSPHFVPGSRTTPANRIASHVRGWWGWV